MSQRNGAKHKALQHIITAFAIEICPSVKADKFNKAWHRLWCRIHKIGLFPKNV